MKMRRSSWVFLVVLVAVAAMVFTDMGCAAKMTPEERAAAIVRNDTEKAEIETATAEARRKLDEAVTANKPEDEVKKLQLELQIWKGLATANQAERNDLENPGKPISTLLMTLGGLIPPQYGGFVTLAGFLAAAVENRRAAKQTAISHATVNSIDTWAAANNEKIEVNPLSDPIVRAELAKVTGAHEFVEKARS